jgi:hypothetical protein
LSASNDRIERRKLFIIALAIAIASLGSGLLRQSATIGTAPMIGELAGGLLWPHPISESPC